MRTGREARKYINKEKGRGRYRVLPKLRGVQRREQPKDEDCTADKTEENNTTQAFRVGGSRGIVAWFRKITPTITTSPVRCENGGTLRM